MGKGGRIACIFVPFALTVASFVCLVLLELGGWNKSSAELNSLYLFQANFTNFNPAKAGAIADSTTLTTALQLAKSQNAISNIYQVHLWNYCYSSSSASTIEACTPRQANFVFDPIDVWRLNSTNITAALPSGIDSNVVQSQINAIKDNLEQFENQLLGESGRKALDTYRTVAKWMFIAYQVSFWTTLATIAASLLAICSRWGSFLTWILSLASTFFTIGAVLTSTILFSVLVGALKGVLEPYGVTTSLGTRAVTLGWIAAALSLTATLFWLFSVCCCSGSSNPHHRSNKGGLWSARPQGRSLLEEDRDRSRRGFLGVEKVGGYQRVSSPFLGHHERDHGYHSPAGQQYPQSVPLQQYPTGQTNGYEPYRHV